MPDPRAAGKPYQQAPKQAPQGPTADPAADAARRAAAMQAMASSAQGEAAQQGMGELLDAKQATAEQLKLQNRGPNGQ